MNDISGRLTKVSNEKVELVHVPDFKSFSKCRNIFDAKRIIEREVSRTEFLIARLPSAIGSLAVKFAKKHSVPYAIEVVGCCWDAYWNYGNLQGRLLAPVAFANMRRLVRSSKYTLYVTNEWLQKKYPCRGFTIGCSNVDIPDPDKNVLRRRLQRIEKRQPGDKVRLGMIGNLGSIYKGFDTAIKAVRLLSDNNQNIELYVVGPGDPRRWTSLAEKENVGKIVHFVGALESGEPVYDWLDSIDIYLQPSRTEGLPRATIEAMSRGCPVVGSQAGGIPELIESECVHSVGDGKDLADKIAALIQDRSRLLFHAKRNFDNSAQYARTVLDSKRRDFWNAVIKVENNHPPI